MIETAFPLLCTCPRGLPPYLKAEIEALGLPVHRELRLGVETHGTLRDAMRLNLHLRTAHRVLAELAHFPAKNAALIHARSVKLRWEELIPADGYVTTNASVHERPGEHSGHAALKLKDAIVDRIRKKTGERPDSGPEQHGAAAFLHWQRDRATVYLDTTGDSLSRRGYRLQPHRAPLQESLASAMLMAAGYSGGHFVNPMCGSGTLACEAALMAMNQAPGSMRASFAFQGLLGYDDSVWQDMVCAAEDAERDHPGGRIIVTDRDPAAVDAARANAKRAGLAQFMEFEVCDFADTELPDLTDGGIVMLNPEYGVRLGEEDGLGEVYSAIGDFFKKRCQGAMGYIFTGNQALAKRVGLKARRRFEFWNAKIECRLLSYELYGGTRKVKEKKD